MPQAISDGRVFQQDVSPPSESRSQQYGVTASYGIFSVLIVCSNSIFCRRSISDGYEGLTHGRHRGTPRPYTSSHRSSNARIIKPETCPKNFAEMAACKGFANAKAIWYLTRVDSFPPEAFATGSNFQVVSRVLKRGVEEDATALREWMAVSSRGWSAPRGLRLTLTESYGEQVTLLT